MICSLVMYGGSVAAGTSATHTGLLLLLREEEADHEQGGAAAAGKEHTAEASSATAHAHCPRPSPLTPCVTPDTHAPHTQC